MFFHTFSPPSPRADSERPPRPVSPTLQEPPTALSAPGSSVASSVMPSLISSQTHPLTPSCPLALLFTLSTAHLPRGGTLSSPHRCVPTQHTLPRALPRLPESDPLATTPQNSTCAPRWAPRQRSRRGRLTETRLTS